MKLLKENIMIGIPTKWQPPPKHVTKYNIIASWKNGQTIINLTISDHTCYIINAWYLALFNTTTELVEVMAFNAPIDHPFFRKKKRYLCGR